MSRAGAFLGRRPSVRLKGGMDAVRAFEPSALGAEARGNRCPDAMSSAHCICI